jgi:serine/threonine protein kinase
MTPERWRQVDDLCQACLVRPVEERGAFLAQACAGDHDLRREVESLLANESSEAQFMSVPAAAIAGAAVLDHAEGVLVGQHLGQYVIRALLGVGGMGEVYRAHDSTLGREVAIKVLPPAFTADPERRARLDREARILATLNHPHIGAIYGVEEAGGVRALVLELVEGQTLAARIAQATGPATRHAGLPLVDALSIARQIADGLDAAHEKGIVHRDLKPANIKITPDGVVKVLDFGLAKVPAAEPAEPGLMQSHAGAILGTAAYMSPEQARGHGVDKRADIWAFGCVLYEMLTGRLAFAGETASDMIAKIIERDPDWSALPDVTPMRIRRLLIRCLTKDPKQRLRDIAEARIAIDTADDVVPGRNEQPVTPGPPRGRGTWLPWVALVVLAIVAGVAAVAWRGEPVAPTIDDLDDPFANAEFSQFTDWSGNEGAADISPDGKFVVFTADKDGQIDLWLSQVGTGQFTNLTVNVPPLDPPRSDALLRSAGFAADGGEIWLFPSGGAGDAALIPLTGGDPRPFLGAAGRAPAWSPDGTELAFFRNGGGDPLFLADGGGAEARPITVQGKGVLENFFGDGMHNHNPVWSTDGRWIYFVHGKEPTIEMNIWRTPRSGGPPEQLTQDTASVNFLAPISARTLLYVAPARDRSGPWLWALDVERKVSRRVISGLERYTSVSASRDGRRVVATVANPVASLWQVPLLDRVATDTDAQPYAVQTPRALGPRFRDSSLFYLSSRGAVDGLWRRENGQVSEVWRGTDAALTEPAAISADGRTVAVVTWREGKRHLGIMSADGTNFRTLAPSIDIQGAVGESSVDWSPDGRLIVAGGSDASGPGLFKIPVDGGTPVRIYTGTATNPIWSPNGELIVYSGALVAGQVPLLAVRADGVEAKLPPVNVRTGAYRFLRTGKSVIYLPRRQSVDFWLFDLTTGKTQQLTRFSNKDIVTTFDLTPDGTHIVFDRTRENSDIVLIDLPK